MNKTSIYQYVLLNALPVLGYWFWGWSMFAIIYIYWLEAVLMSFFVFLKISMAEGIQPGADSAVRPLRRVYSGFKVLLLRVGILMFYWIFIFVFVAMGQGKYSNEQTMENMKIIVFMHPGFNLAVLAFFLSQIIEFLRDFILNDTYKNTYSGQHKQFLDERTIVIHIVVIVGTFGYQFLERFINIDDRLPGLGFVLIMFFVKTISDIFIHSNSYKDMTAAWEKRQKE